jgi:UDP-2,3-diacylglucosamine hydrolase
MIRIGILAGGGGLPLAIAESVVARGGSVHIVGLKGEADLGIERFPHTWVDWGEIQRILTTLRGAGGRAVVIAGSVRRPDPWKVRFDWGVVKVLPMLLDMMTGGDNALLTQIVQFFEANGIAVRGVHEVAGELVAGAGPVGERAMSDAYAGEVRFGFAVSQALGSFDVGQAVVVADRRVLAIEGAEGTDAMLERTVAFARKCGQPGILVKRPKPDQELRVDMPVVGPQTIEKAARAGLAGVAIEAGRVLVLDRANVARIADHLGCFVHGLAPQLTLPVGQAPPLPEAWTQLGKRPIPRRDRPAIARGIALIRRLAPLATARSSVVVRHHVLAVEGAEGALAMLHRVGALRQWGDRRTKRKIGVIALRVAAGVEVGDEVLRESARQGLAGIAASGTKGAIFRLARAAPLADRLGLFLCASEEMGDEN